MGGSGVGRAAWLTAFALGIFSSTSARATSSQVPARFVERELALPARSVRVDDGSYWPLPRGVVSALMFVGEDDFDSFWAANAGFGVGVLENFEVGADVVRLTFDPTEVGDPAPYGLYRFIETSDFELGAYLQFSLPFGSRILMLASAPLAYHVGSTLRFDSGVFFAMSRPEDTHSALIVPLQIPINVTPGVHLGPEAALIASDGNSDALFGFFVGGTITTAGGTAATLGGRYRIPSTDLMSDVGFRLFQVLFELELFFDF